MSLAIELPFGVCELIILPGRCILSKLVEILDFEHLEVVILKSCSPTLTEVFLSVPSVFGMESRFLIRDVITKLSSTFGSSFSVRLNLVSILFEVSPIIVGFVEVRIVPKIPIEELLLLFLG